MTGASSMKWLKQESEKAGPPDVSDEMLAQLELEADEREISRLKEMGVFIPKNGNFEGYRAPQGRDWQVWLDETVKTGGQRFQVSSAWDVEPRRTWTMGSRCQGSLPHGSPGGEGLCGVQWRVL